MKRFLPVSLLLSLVVMASAATFDLANANLAYVAGSGAVVLDENASLVGGNFTGGSPLSLTMSIISGLVAGEDLLQIRAAGPVTVASGVVSVSGTPIGSYSGGGGGTPLTITITAGSNVTSVETLVRALAYHNLAGSGASATARLIRITVTDANGAVFDQRTVDVGAGNAAPALTIGGVLSVQRTERKSIGPAIMLTTDNEDSPDELRYQLVTLPQRGNLLLTGIDTLGNLTTTVVLGGSFIEFTQADINGGRLRYDHLGGAETSDTFTLRVRDSNGVTTPLTALNISITGTTTDPVITLPVTALTCTEQGPAVAMDPAAPGLVGITVNDGDSLHYRRGRLVVQLVDTNGGAAGTTGDTISLRAANAQVPVASQSGYICVVGSSVYIRQTGSGAVLPTTGSNDAPDQLLGTIDATDNGQAGRPLSITFASSVVWIMEEHGTAGDHIIGENEVVTPDAIELLIANLQLSHPGDAPLAAPRFMAVTLSEAAPNTASGSAQRPISIVPVNDPPVFTLAGPLNLSAVVGRPTIVTLLANDPDLPSGASLVYRLDNPVVAGVALDPASGAVTWIPTSTAPVNLELVAQDEQGADSVSLFLTITPLAGPTADAPYVVSDPLVELGDGELIFHPFTITPPLAGALNVVVQVVGDAPLNTAVDPVSADKLSWTLTAPSVTRPADGIYTFGLRVVVTTGSGTKIGYQPITLVVLGVGGSN